MVKRKGLRTVTLGRGLGRHKAVVFDLILLGGGKTLHVETPTGTRCGRKGEVTLREKDIDARALRVGPYVVCADCRDLIGNVPAPKWMIEEEA